MAKKKKNKGGGVKKLIRQAGPNISKKEMKQITKATGGNVAKALNKISAVQQSMKSAGKTAPSVASGAANMLIKQQQKSPFAFGRSGLGDSKIAQTIRQMAGTPDYRSAKQQQMGLGPGATAGTGMMIGGTVIRPGGKVAVKKRPVQAAIGGGDQVVVDDTGLGETGPGETGSGETGTGGTGLTIDDILGALGDFEMPTFEMPDFSGMFDQLSAQYDTPDPLQLAALGKAYGADMMRARQRQRKSRADYLRGPLGMMAGAGRSFSPLMIGGALTL